MSAPIPVLRASLAELVGTFTLVFVGTSAIMVNELSGGAAGLIGIAAAFGLAAAVMIYSVGHISGAHINPAVTIGFWAAGRFPTGRVAPYIAAQIVGGIAASALAVTLFGKVANLGATLPSGDIMQSFGLEIVLTFFLVFVIISVVTGAKELGVMAGLIIGGTIAMDIFFGGPVSGASMNPARSIGPALVSGNMTALWIYLAGPVIGALVAVGVFKAVVEEKE